MIIVFIEYGMIVLFLMWGSIGCVGVIGVVVFFFECLIPGGMPYFLFLWLFVLYIGLLFWRLGVI